MENNTNSPKKTSDILWIPDLETAALMVIGGTLAIGTLCLASVGFV